MRAKKYKLFLMLLVALLLIRSLTQSAIATPLIDDLNDVWSVSEQIKGDYANSGDIKYVTIEGSSIIVECEESLITLSENTILFFMLLFSDDNNPTDWEAAMMFSYSCTGLGTVYWIVGAPQGPLIEWNSDNIGTHYTLIENSVRLTFIEYGNVKYADVIIQTMVKENKELYLDWSPENYEFSMIFDIFSELIDITPIIVEQSPSSILTGQTSSEEPETTTTDLITSNVSTIPILIILLIACIYKKRKKNR